MYFEKLSLYNTCINKECCLVQVLNSTPITVIFYAYTFTSSRAENCKFKTYKASGFTKVPRLLYKLFLHGSEYNGDLLVTVSLEGT